MKKKKKNAYSIDIILEKRDFLSIVCVSVCPCVFNTFDTSLESETMQNENFEAKQ